MRDGEALRRIGVSAELFDDHSPLQIGAAGRHMGSAFQVVGRQQIGYAGGSWNEWHVLFDSGGSGTDGAPQRSGWLSEDNGAYVMSFEAALSGAPPVLDALQPGQPVNLGGSAWSVASTVRAQVLAAEGELPRPPRGDGAEFTVVDLRNTAGEVGTLDGSDPARLSWSVGRSVRLVELQMSGLRESGEKTLTGRGIQCPSCGTALSIQLASTQSIVCTQCRAVVDLSRGVGQDLQHFDQAKPQREPQLPLGSVGVLKLGAEPLPWQVVGYSEHREIDTEPGEPGSSWREYLLYQREEGFTFLVDAEDGWSWARPIAGVPQVRNDSATWRGDTYRALYSYNSTVTHVQGEFYWRLQRGARTRHTDYAVGSKRLNCERSLGERAQAAAAKAKGQQRPAGQSAAEITWSAGEAVEAAAVAKAFALDAGQARAIQRDVSPLSATAPKLRLWLIVAVVLLVLVVPALLNSCQDSECDKVRNNFGQASAEYQQCVRNAGSSGGMRGGSFGGFSSGGGSHK